MHQREMHFSAGARANATTPERGRSVVICYDHSDRVRRAVRGATALLRRHSAIEMSVAPTAEAILATAHEHHVALIVVGVGHRQAPPPAPPSPPPGGVSSTLVQRADVPLLVVPSARTAAAAEHNGPILLCFDGSDEARSAVGAAADLLAPRDAILASFLEPVDDNALLRTTLPWSPSAATQRQLAGLDQQEAEFLAQLATEGATLAGKHGLRSRPLAIEGPGSVPERMLDAATTARASCIVVGHRPAAGPLHSTALALARHSDRPVLVVPRARPPG